MYRVYINVKVANVLRVLEFLWCQASEADGDDPWGEDPGGPGYSCQGGEQGQDRVCHLQHHWPCALCHLAFKQSGTNTDN